MPRPKKVGAPQPKKRSRNGCWPCKSRKVKCDEAHPSCLNCQRQGEICDYSIRLNWEGRGKKRTEIEAADSSQATFSSNMITSAVEKPSAGSAGSTTNDGPLTGTPPESYMSMDTRGTPSRYINTSSPTGPIESHTRSSPSSTGLRHSQHFESYPHPSNPDSMIDPLLMNPHSPLTEVHFSRPYDRVYSPSTDQIYAQSYERYHPMTSNRNDLVQQVATARFGTDIMRNSGPPSPSEPNAGSSGILMFSEIGTPTSTRLTYTSEHGDDDKGMRGDIAACHPHSKRMKYDHSDSLGVVIGMPPPIPSSSLYGNSFNTLAPRSASSQLGSASSQLGSAVPLTPASSSTYSDDSLKSLSAKLSRFAPQDSRDDPRRLSVESLLSGPPGINIPYKANQTLYNGLTPEVLTYRSHHSTSSGGDILEEMTTWGIDRGFKDFDEGQNDDANAISGGSPITTRSYLDFDNNDGEDLVPIEFGFGVQAKDTAFEKGNYYQRPINIRLPKSFEPLPPSLTDNPMNLLYFHHFISHTARILVPHHCSANPFQNILPKMALQDPKLMNLMLAYSASHRARLLQQPEPAIRIARWVQDIFPNLRHDLNDPTRIVSNSNLATAIMLASLEIISPKAFGVAIPWQNHLSTARQIILARGGAKSIHRDHSQSSDFLLRWFAYLDVLGSLIGGPSDLPSASVNSEDYDLDEGDEENDYQIDCLLGFTSRCVSILAKIAHLSRVCDGERIDSNQSIRLEWKPDEKIEVRAEKLISDLENARTNTRIQPCPHLHSAGEAAYQWDFQEMQATNEAFHFAGLIHIHRRILGKPSSHPDVQLAVREISGALYKVRKGSTAESCLLFPMFTAGCDAQDEKQRNAIMDRFRGVEEFGMSHVYNARTLMQRVWETGKPWETLVSGEFVG